MNMKMSLQGFAIVVLDKGFVYVGSVEICEEWCVIKNAKNIRRWGTKKGLGELALEGPQSDTALDLCGVVRAPKSALIHIIETEEKKWTP